MKYEIIKGSKKDFDGAPEWAVYLAQLPGYYGLSVWVSADDSYCRYVKSGREFNGAFLNVSWFGGVKVIAERRPVTEPVWDGEGLPPVGVECEWLDNRESYVHVKIMYSSKDAIVIRGRSQAFNEDVDIPLDPVFEPARCKFRPIRSSEDVARDEAISKMLMVEGGMPDSYQPHELVAAIYDAGYRKLEGK